MKLLSNLSSNSWSFNSLAPHLAALAVFFIPFKLTFSYIFLVPLITFWVSKNYTNLNFYKTKISNSTAKIFLFFLLYISLTAPFGIDAIHSIKSISGLLFYPLIIPLFIFLGRHYFNYLTKSLLLGITSASFLNAYRLSGWDFSYKLIGSVSQSGQIGILIFLFLYYCKTNSNLSLKNISFNFKLILCSFSAILFSSLLLNAWKINIIPQQLTHALPLIVVFLGLILFFYSTTEKKEVIFRYFSWTVIIAALIFNLKRGPWLGVTTALFFVVILSKNKKYLLYLSIICLASLYFEPVRERIIHAKDHFFITGGRSEIWSIGFELLQKYPLGIGYENSGILRNFSTTIPHNLKHFHSNMLNIAVEAGWIGLTLFLASVTFAIKEFLPKCNNTKNYLELIPFAACIISWFVAGLVEYNFGDSAVCNLLYIVIGLAYSQKLLIDSSYQSQS
jgi:hypothetical protein